MLPVLPYFEGDGVVRPAEQTLAIQISGAWAGIEKGGRQVAGASLFGPPAHRDTFGPP